MDTFEILIALINAIDSATTIDEAKAAAAEAVAGIEPEQPPHFYGESGCIVWVKE